MLRNLNVFLQAKSKQNNIAFCFKMISLFIWNICNVETNFGWIKKYIMYFSVLFCLFERVILI